MKLTIINCLLLACVLISCNKDKDLTPTNQTTDTRDVEAGKYLPAFMGSKWVYGNYEINGANKTRLGKQTTRYDSIPNYFFNFDDNDAFLSYGYWYRDGLNDFRSGGAILLFTNRYVNFKKGLPILTDSSSSSKRYVYGGIDTIQTTLGKIPCIKTSGMTNRYRWFRYFGYGIGVVKEEEYDITTNQDTINHSTLELESYLIKR
ncbi:MAG: hypothetical protein V4613_02315 [Bacteroidota bacterium]